MLEQQLRKTQITQTAEQLFSQRGYHATTMREIAATLGMEGGSLYGHISGKYELLYSIVLEASEKFRVAAQEVLNAGGTPPQQLHQLMRYHVAIVAASPHRAVVFHHEWKQLNPQHRAELIDHRNEYEQAFRQIIQSGMASGDFAVTDEKLAAITVLSLLNWTYQWFQPVGTLNAEQLADYFYSTIMQGLEARPQPLLTEKV